MAMHLPIERFRLRNATPMVSFTLDDLPKSAATAGADILEAHGARGTFYVSGGIVGVCNPHWAAGTIDDVLALRHRGHEIGCHTFSHLRACDLDEASLADEIVRNRDYFAALDASIEATTFAYPFGYGSFARKPQLKSKFLTCRSIRPGVNSGSVDPQFLHASPLIDGQISHDGIERLFDDAQATNGWLIFYGHDVADRPSPWGCTPALMNYAVEAACRRNIPALTMAEAFRCARA
jgi:peptidoglycan/xylan/chitin deacetylase (PgdA/CDA1 family)